jgi:hypothetical protein
MSGKNLWDQEEGQGWGWETKLSIYVVLIIVGYYAIKEFY